MARPRSEFRNEIKSRVPDHVYEGVQRFRAVQQIDSDSRAISQLLEIALYGMAGSVPLGLDHFRPESGQSGTRTPWLIPA